MMVVDTYSNFFLVRSLLRTTPAGPWVVKNMIDRDVELETWIDKLLVVVLVPGARRWFIQP
jgi:hypothetical protein